MDKLVDHVWVLGEDEAHAIRDYPGNYTQYRQQREAQPTTRHSVPAKPQETQAPAIKGDYSQRLSYKERLEFEQLEGQIQQLEEARIALEGELNGATDHQELQRLSTELSQVSQSLETAEFRWLELSERA